MPSLRNSFKSTPAVGEVLMQYVSKDSNSTISEKEKKLEGDSDGGSSYIESNWNLKTLPALKYSVGKRNFLFDFEELED